MLREEEGDLPSEQGGRRSAPGKDIRKNDKIVY